MDRTNVALMLELTFLPAYLTIFHTIHPDQHGDGNMLFRLRLLKFIVMFVRRSKSREITFSQSALQALRRRRRVEAKSFRSHIDDSRRPNLPRLIDYLDPTNTVAIYPGRICPSPSLASNNSSAVDTGFASVTLSLLDTLPAFMALSAAQTVMQEGTITDVWMHLAAGYMVQAVAEQYLVFGSKSEEVLQEAFAWGFDADCNAEDGSDEWQINAMFFGEDEVINGWDRIRDEHICAVSSINGFIFRLLMSRSKLVPPEGTSLQEHLAHLLEGDLSITRFDQYILNFLTGLHLSQPRPLLIQLERGKLDGLSKQRTQELQRTFDIA